MVCCNWLAGPAIPPPGLPGSTFDTADTPLPEGSHFVSATILWQGAAILLNVTQLCDWLTALAWHHHSHVFSGNYVIGYLHPSDPVMSRYKNTDIYIQCVHI